jgi:hypothetical protein
MKSRVPSGLTDDGALLGRDGGGGDGEGVVLGVGVVGQHRDAAQRGVFGGDEDAVVHGDGGIVLAIDGDGQGGAGGVAVLVGDGVGEDLGQGVAGAHGGHRGVGVVEAVGVAAVGGQGEGAVGAGQGGAEGARGGAEAHVADRARDDCRRPVGRRRHRRSPPQRRCPLVVVGAVVKPSFTLLVSALAVGWSSTMRMVRVPLALLPPASVISRARTSVLSLTPGVV